MTMQKFFCYRGHLVHALVVAIFCGLIPQAQAAPAGKTSISLGAEYTSGDYGTSSETNIWYFPVTFRYETDRYMMALTVPYVSVEGTGNVVATGGAHGLPSTTTTGESQTESGLGDIEVSASHIILETDAGWRFDLGGRIKFGTADEQDNLGTGEEDVSVQLEAEKTFGINSLLFGTAGYKVLGDPPGISYDNVFYGSLGISRRLDEIRAAGVELYAQEAALSGTDGQLDLTLFLGKRLDAKTRLTGYLLAGLADGSPDWGVGVTLKLSQ
ncbi:MAG: hypothetical protein A2140_03310 [Candidatus Muproteobacteria bacterium RBG_16_62_13]|uniref:Transporter n=1 Tax=Candidatus Muproteobacteria bacterium RBG_16_62_13 TaxID=1817756 RepID=A0A1F6SZS4_9PROT|nr:MAG: hypothetical protein A2140_03310 [Candidatus Muproteobacteria bacterium RBG_16_62_13]